VTPDDQSDISFAMPRRIDVAVETDFLLLSTELIFVTPVARGAAGWGGGIPGISCLQTAANVKILLEFPGLPPLRTSANVNVVE